MGLISSALGGDTAKPTKLSIYQVEVEQLKDKIASFTSNPPTSSGEDDDSKFVVNINPASFRFQGGIRHSGGNTGNSSECAREQPAGQHKQTLRYNGHAPEQISFSIELDGTGAVDGIHHDVTKKVQHLKKITYQYKGKDHEAPSILIVWGTLVFPCRLTSLSIDYKLFDSEGKPLRASISLSFTETFLPEEISKDANAQSPDLSHIRVVQAGDTLPLMCKRIYGNSNMYLEVARVNGLVNFRDLKSGTEILFPPIKN